MLSWTVFSLHLIGLMHFSNAKDIFQVPTVTKLHEDDLHEAADGLAQIENLVPNATGVQSVEGGVAYGQLLVELQHLVIDTHYDYLSSTAHISSTEAANLALVLRNQQLKEWVEELQVVNKGIFHEMKAKNEMIDKLADVNEDLTYQLSNVFSLVNESDAKYRECSLGVLDADSDDSVKVQKIKEMMAQERVELTAELERRDLEIRTLKSTIRSRDRALDAASKKTVWLSSKLQALSAEWTVVSEISKKAGAKDPSSVEKHKSFATDAVGAAVSAAEEAMNFTTNALKFKLEERDAELAGSEGVLAELKLAFEAQRQRIETLMKEKLDEENKAEEQKIKEQENKELKQQRQVLYESFSRQMVALKTQSNTLALSLDSLTAGRHVVMAQIQAFRRAFAIIEAASLAARELLLVASDRSEILNHNLMLLSTVLGTCADQLTKFNDDIAGRDQAIFQSITKDLDGTLPELNRIFEMLGSHITGEKKELNVCVGRTSYLEMELQKLAGMLREGDHASLEKHILDLLKLDPEKFQFPFDVDPKKSVEDRAERAPHTLVSTNPEDMMRSDDMSDQPLFEDTEPENRDDDIAARMGMNQEAIPEHEAPPNSINGIQSGIQAAKRKQVSVSGAEILCYVASLVCLCIGFIQFQKFKASQTQISRLEGSMREGIK